MTTPSTLSLKKIYSGKVRDLYEIDDKRMLMVATDRLSAFDVILDQPIPEKGKILTAISNFWFDKLSGIVPNHFTGDRVEDVVPAAELPLVEGRAVVAKRLKPVAVEAIVRGYIVGSGWKEYQKSGTVCGIQLPAGLKEASKLPQPIFTPSTKAESGHDEAIDFGQAVEAVGDPELMERVRDISIQLYLFGAEHARANGVILADTKFEFGLDADNNLVIGDEVLTPDSSRYWPADTYEVGKGQPSFDKQYVRDWATESGWDKSPPAPAIPDDVVEGTRGRYIEAYEKVTGEPFDAWLERTGAQA